MLSAGVAVLAVLAVFGALKLLHGICCRLLRGSAACDGVTIYVRGSGAGIESTVRSLILKNPNTEIVVIDEGQNREMSEILDKLCRECAQVHIERASGK